MGGLPSRPEWEVLPASLSLHRQFLTIDYGLYGTRLLPDWSFRTRQESTGLVKKTRLAAEMEPGIQGLEWFLRFSREHQCQRVLLAAKAASSRLTGMIDVGCQGQLLSLWDNRAGAKPGQ